MSNKINRVLNTPSKKKNTYSIPVRISNLNDQIQQLENELELISYKLKHKKFN